MSQPNYPRDRMLPTRLVRERYLIVDRTINQSIDRGILPSPCVSMACATGAKVTWRSASGKACLPATPEVFLPNRKGGSAASSMASEAATDIERFHRVPIEDEIKRRSIELKLQGAEFVGPCPVCDIVPSVAVPHAALPAFARCAARPIARPQRSAGANTICHRGWEDMSLGALWERLNNPRQTSQSTIEAILVAVRTRGLAALKEPANLERLRRCDAKAQAEIDRRIDTLFELGILEKRFRDPIAGRH